MDLNKLTDMAKIFFKKLFLNGFDKYYKKKFLFTKNKTLLILRLDAIGDYILFRNFLKEIRESEKYRDYKITLCGNEIWKDITEEYDKSYADEFIWIDKNKFKRKSEWKYSTGKMMEIHNKGFETVINPITSFSRITDYIVERCGAKNIINADSDNQFLLSKKENKDSENNFKEMFQFYRNREFTEKLASKKISLDKPEFKIEKNNTSDKYLVLFPGAGYISRKWSGENFTELIRCIRLTSDIKIIICGNSEDRISADLISGNSGLSGIENMAGKTTLPELIRIIADAELLISNETCAVHIAASVNTKTICISNGNHFGRFNPYPSDVFPYIKTIYPKEIKPTIENFIELYKKYYIASEIDINLIQVNEVFEILQQFQKFKTMKTDDIDLSKK